MIWDDWINEIHTGDCLTIMAQMPRGMVDLVVTSPPYNILNSTGNGLASNQNGKWAAAGLTRGYAEHDDRMEEGSYVQWQRDCLTAMLDLLPEHGAIYYNHKWRVQNGLLQDRSDIMAGMPVRQVIVWERSGGFNHNAGYHLPTYEVIYLLAKNRFRLNRIGRATTDVWRIDQERDNPHPAAFPVEVAARAIRGCDAEVVLDPFMGSGTTALAAMQEGRRYVGVELAETYCEMARRRIAMHGNWAPDGQMMLME